LESVVEQPVPIALIPPGCSLDTVLAAMKAMAACYPDRELMLNHQVNGTAIYYDRAVMVDGAPVLEEEPEVNGRIEAGDGSGARHFYDFAEPEDMAKGAVANFRGLLQNYGVGNFVTMTVIGKGETYAVTVQRVDGDRITPAMKIAELEAEVGRLRRLGGEQA
jgi:hypothetical protein